MTQILGIESSCDETAAAVLRDGHEVLANVVASQIDQHAAYGGVIPELAAREHLRAINPIVRETLAKADCSLDDIDAIAVTARPGLLAALLVGVNYAKGLAQARDLPLIGVDHILAHVYGAFIDEPDRRADPTAYPVVALVVSGGHSSLLLLEADGRLEQLGQTLDDAAGEAFDKAAKLLGLGYPGGPVIDRLAKQGNPEAFDFPRGLTGASGTAVKPEHRYCFSFSGVKTALLYHLRDLTGTDPASGSAEPGELAQALDEATLLDTVASYQEAIIDALAQKLAWAAADQQAGTLVLCGGVACNSRLRTRAAEVAENLDIPLIIAPPRYCTDNAAMIAGAAYHYLQAGLVDGPDLDATTRFRPPPHVPFAASYSPAETP